MVANFKRQDNVKAPAKPAPKRKAARAASKRKQGLSLLVGGGHYDAFHRAPQPIARAVGHATSIRGFGRAALPNPSDSTITQMMVVFTQSASGYVASLAMGQGGSYWKAPPIGFFEITNTNVGQAGGPTQVLYGKLSVRLRNTTMTFEVSGSVYSLMLDTGCTLEPLTSSLQSLPGWTALRDYTLGCPRTRVFSGAELMKTRQWNLHPIDAARSLAFWDSGAARHTQAVFREDQEEPVFSQLVLVFQLNNPFNSYEFSFANQLYGRYELGGPLANAAQPVPTAPINVIDGARKVMEEVGSVGHLATDLVGAASAFKMAAGL
jgi:hypothetical protein